MYIYAAKFSSVVIILGKFILFLETFFEDKNAKSYELKPFLYGLKSAFFDLALLVLFKLSI